MNLFELFVKISADTEDAEKGIERMKERGGALQSVFSGLGSVVSGFGKAAATAVGAAATAIGTLAKQAITSYANIEQLEGGAKLLFGDAYDYISKRASEAYKNVQMSSAAYLQQVNAFATGLKTSLGGDEQAAAELADRIITAQADIVAATGASQEMVSNAFVGLMRNNYTMLDNLQLGITPTKEGFQQLINTVNKANAAQGKYTNYQMDNLADMQSALIDYIEMQGLAGYAGMEAADTISGATASMKAAWEDFVASLSDPTKDFSKVSQNLVDSIVRVAELIGPRLINTLPRITGALSTLFRQLAPQAVGMVKKMAPELAGAVTTMIQTLVDNFPELMSVAETLVQELGGAVVDALPMLMDAAGELVTGLGSYIAGNASNLLFAASDLLFGLLNGMIEGIPQLASTISDLIDNLFGEGGFLAADNIANVVSAGVDMIGHLFDNVADGVVMLVNKIPEIIDGFISGLLDDNNLLKIVHAGIDMIKNLFTDVGAIVEALFNAASKIITSLVEALESPEFWEQLMNAGLMLIEYLFSADFWDVIWRVAKSIVTMLFNAMWDIANALSGGLLESTYGQAIDAAQIAMDNTRGINRGLGDQSQYMGNMQLDPYATAGMNGSYTITQNNTFDSTASPSEIKARTQAALEGALSR